MVKTWARHKSTETVLNNGWQLAAVGGWWLMAVGGWRSMVVGGWGLVAVGGWRLVVGGGGRWHLAVGGPWGLSLTKKLLGFLRIPHSSSYPPVHSSKPPTPNPSVFTSMLPLKPLSAVGCVPSSKHLKHTTGPQQYRGAPPPLPQKRLISGRQRTPWDHKSTLGDTSW